MKMIARTAMAAALLFPVTAMAHPGPHPEELGWSLFHAFTESDHLLTMALVIVCAAMIAAVAHWFQPWRAASWRR